MSLIRSIIRPFYKAATVPTYVKNRMAWRVRYLLSPFTAKPVRLMVEDGAQFDLADDFIDDRIIEETYGRFYRLFFPDALNPFPENGLILDVGAHHGAYSVIALRKYKSARMIAVEPDPVGAKMLRNNLAINGVIDRVEIVEGAISDADGTSTFVEDPMGSWGNHLLREDTGPSNGVKVKTFRLGSVLKGRTPALLKINAEGAEFDLVPQMFAMQIFPKWIILLAHPEAGDVEKLLQQMRERGYEITPVESDSGRPRYHCVKN